MTGGVTPRTVAIVQARRGSTRFPGKVLMDLGGAPVLNHVLHRCCAIPGIDLVCCATTTSSEDDVVASLAAGLGVAVFRGSEGDVLGRYRGAAAATSADVILRVTSDCPLIDPAVCGGVLALRASERADFATNNMPPSWPHGLDCEAFTAALLKRAAGEATEVQEREHVSPWMRKQPDIRKVNLPCTRSGVAHLRWTIDYPEDLEFFRALFAQIPGEYSLPSYEVVLSVLDKDPSLLQLNALRSEASRQHMVRLDE